MPGTRSGDLSSFERWPAGAGGGDSVPTLDHSSIAFGDADGVINGTDAGLPGGVHDPDFTGFHRIEYGLWHGESTRSLKAPAAASRLSRRPVKSCGRLRTAADRVRLWLPRRGLPAHLR